MRGFASERTTGAKVPLAPNSRREKSCLIPEVKKAWSHVENRLKLVAFRREELRKNENLHAFFIFRSQNEV